MVVLTRRQVAHLLQERHKAMADTRFRPENFHEIHRVLGVRYAPDLTRVVSKQRANVASAYLKRLQMDVDRAKGGFYNQLQTLPLQIKRMKIHTEETRTYRSVLVPKLKLPTVDEDDAFSSQAVSPKTLSPKSVSPGAELPPLLLASGSSWVPHKSFSPHTNTHIHVLYKQVPGSVTPRKGAGSVVSNSPSVQGTGTGTQSVADTKSRSSSVHLPSVPPADTALAKSRRPSLLNHSVPDTTNAKSRRSSLLNHSVPDTTKPRRCSLQFPQGKPSPRDEVRSGNTTEDSESESGSSVQESPQPYSYFKLATDHAPLPQIKKRLFVNLMPRSEPPRAMLEQAGQIVTSSPGSRMVSRKGRNGIPPKVVTSLAAGGTSSAALYKFVLPSNLAASYTSPHVERPKALVMGSKARLPLPSIAAKTTVRTQLLAVTSVRSSHIVQAAA